MHNELYHYGILGQKWGVRRYQNLDGTLTPAGRKRLERLDNKWAHKNQKKITRAVQKSVDREMRDYSKQELDPKYRRNKYTTRGKINSYYVNEYNRKLASLMNERVGNIESPSGRVVRFVAKRGDVGVHMALADVGYDMNQLRNGVWSSGKIAYRNQSVEVSHWAIQNGSNELYHHGILGQKWGVRRYQNYDGSLTVAGRNRYGFFRKAADQVITNYAVISSKKHLTKRLKESTVKTVSDLPTLKEQANPADSCNDKVINPFFPGIGTTGNCIACTCALAMREKKYDVRAQLFDDGFDNAAFLAAFDDVPGYEMPALKDHASLQKYMGGKGEGSYGAIMFDFAGGFPGGHCLFWKVENGVANIYDGQISEQVLFKSLSSNYDLTSALLFDLSNATPNDLSCGLVEPVNEEEVD